MKAGHPTERGHREMSDREAAIQFGSYLENYGQHHGWCDVVVRAGQGPTVMGGQKPEPRCDCGYDGALAEVAEFHRAHTQEGAKK